ncbi:MAG: phosphoglycolate phosphatase [Ectothiorhodospiraceae bacterium]|nr:phosphoglycolate phosphatase [Ectothiorhodospiraceae bacterium]
MTTPAPVTASLGPAESVSAVLFDLDGTLADTLPDLVAALDLALAEHGVGPLGPDRARALVTAGSRAMVSAGLGPGVSAARFEAVLDRFLAAYRADIAERTRLFTGTEAVLDALESAGTRWGVVTSKPAWLTEPLLDALGLLRRAVCVVSGDSVTNPKPHPEPLLLGARLAACAPADCVYVGDALPDVRAARAAGMRSVVALYGYGSAQTDPHTWGADAYVRSTAELGALLAPLAHRSRGAGRTV